MSNDGWGQAWPVAPTPASIERDYIANPLTIEERDTMLMEWDRLKKAVEAAKQAELEYRKLIVKSAVPDAKEGMNTVELGNGYQLKAGVKFSYKLAENDTVEACLDEIAKCGKEGAFISERLVSWTPKFLLTEWRNLQEEAEKNNNTNSKKILEIVDKMLTIEDAAPSLEIKEPKVKKK